MTSNLFWYVYFLESAPFLLNISCTNKASILYSGMQKRHLNAMLFDNKFIKGMNIVQHTSLIPAELFESIVGFLFKIWNTLDAARIPF